MKTPRIPEIIDLRPGAIERLASYCARGAAFSQLRLVADERTWEAAGREAERSLKAAGLATRATVLDGPEPAADARGILRLLFDDVAEERLFVAIGSGTITDLVRFVCHRTGRDFLSLATAPSVDAYSSVVAPIVVEGMKRTVPARAPLAVFAEPEVLARAPRAMIAAGFGDMVCKFSAAADWRLGALLWGESFDEAIARRSVAAANGCVEAIADIGAARADGAAQLMAGLVESGICMALAGHSRPASGAEHQYSHFWEMKLLREGRPPVLHGLKVGIGTLETARLWEAVGVMGADEAKARLAASKPPARVSEEHRIRAAYGELAPEVLATQERFLAMDPEAYESLKARIGGNWEVIRALAAAVPSRDETERLLVAAGCPTDARTLGLGEAEIAASLDSAHYLRDRFTVVKLARVLGLRP